MASQAAFAGPSGLCIEAMVPLTLRGAGNGESTNGSSNTLVHPLKRQRRPETWKRAVAKSKQAKGEEYTSPSTEVIVPARGTGCDCKCRHRRFDCVSQSERVAILNTFYGLASKEPAGCALVWADSIYSCVKAPAKARWRNITASHLHPCGKCVCGLV